MTKRVKQSKHHGTTVIAPASLYVALGRLTGAPHLRALAHILERPPVFEACHLASVVPESEWSDTLYKWVSHGYIRVMAVPTTITPGIYAWTSGIRLENSASAARTTSSLVTELASKAELLTWIRANPDHTRVIPSAHFHGC